MSGLVHQTALCEQCSGPQQPSDTNHMQSFIRLLWRLDVTTVLRFGCFSFLCHILWQPASVERWREGYTCERWMLCAVGIMFLPDCAECDVSSKCPHVCLWWPRLSCICCGALTGHARLQSAKCSPLLTACWGLHLSGVLNYGTETPNTKLTASFSSCGSAQPHKAFRYIFLCNTESSGTEPEL